MRNKISATCLIVLIAGGLLAVSLPVIAKQGGPGETAGNSLSFPVIWAEGVPKLLPGTPGTDPKLEGEWWYQWGTNGVDPNVEPASCAPDPDNIEYCIDGSKPGEPAADNPLPLARAYLQKDPNNVWQAGSLDGSGSPVNVDWIDWGDNLESSDWTTNSQVRTEVVLFEDANAGDQENYGWPTPMLEYLMRHTSGWGINEVHGLAATLSEPPTASTGPGTMATVYSYCARLTIQKLLVERDNATLNNLIWVPGEGWTELGGYEGLINPPIFNKPVHEGGDGPGYYSAEINVKGRIIYGYTWNVRKLNEGAGDYRITFSLDQTCGTVSRNTIFAEGITQIIMPAEEEVVIEAEPGGGGIPVLSTDLNLTYIDIRINNRGSGGGGGGGGHTPPGGGGPGNGGPGSGGNGPGGS